MFSGGAASQSGLGENPLLPTGTGLSNHFHTNPRLSPTQQLFPAFEESIPLSTEKQVWVLCLCLRQMMQLEGKKKPQSQLNYSS